MFHHPFTAPRRDEEECTGTDVHPALPPNGDVRPLWQFARPWALGQIRSPTSVVQTWAGKTVRRPCLSVRVDEDTNEDTAEPLLDTAETIHSSVRVRLACAGLGVDDKETWPCESLLGKHKDGKPLWRLEKGLPAGYQPSQPPPNRYSKPKGQSYQPREVTIQSGEYPPDVMYPVTDDDCAWKWVWNRPVTGEGMTQVPQLREIAEEPMTGFWERYFLKLSAGDPDVWRFAFRGLPLGSAATPGGATGDGKGETGESGGKKKRGSVLSGLSLGK